MTAIGTRVTVTAPLERVDLPELTSGLYMSSLGLGMPEIERLVPDDGSAEAAFLAWDALINEAIAEIAPKVQEMLFEAVERRLPWTYEPSDVRG